MKNIVDLIAERNYYDAGLLIAQVYAPCCADCGNKLTPTDIGQGLMRARHHCSSAIELSNEAINGYLYCYTCEQ